MEFDPARFLKLMRRHGHNALLGIEYHAHGEDWVELALPYSPRLVGDTDTGVLASGPIVSLMDMATSISIWIRTGNFQPQATLDLRVDYLRPAVPGKTVVGRGQCYRVTRNIAFIRGQAHDGDPDDPLAHVAGTYMFTGPLK
ncbi:PaaI family thioesterase [Sphingomonas colocasiae]|uniref:PaaI family thioesterase n=1 Tax=Sphingomonas colocasiae TaxID=1848973 RepID=A0ABS7PN09_9SPHN|nr:PaaI family thioesterase [Sphingomonas colocasiae]MBY8822379.1 PaaI family thioesterase [Sphingomonas colocasiae]